MALYHLDNVHNHNEHLDDNGCVLHSQFVANQNLEVIELFKSLSYFIFNDKKNPAKFNNLRLSNSSRVVHIP